MAINEIKDILNHSLHHLASGYVRPRGLLVPIDPWVRGTLRWARKVGAQGSVWRPDTVIWLTADTGTGEYTFYVDHVPASMLIGSILLAGPTEKLLVGDWDTVDLTITTTTVTSKRATKGQSISVWGWPCTVEGGASAGANQITVTSELFVGYGDKLEIPVGTDTDDWKYTTSYQPSDVAFLKETATGYRYLLTLPTGLTRAVAGSETVYFRAYPAYFSGKISLPNFSAEYIKVVGPFLLDWLSGPLTTDTRGTEYFRVKQFRADRDPLTPFVIGEHNAQVNRMPIRADQMLFWRKVTGTLNHQDSRTLCTCDSDGYFRIVETLTPPMTVPAYYATGAINTVATADLVNNDYFTINDGSGHTVTFEFQVDNTFVATVGRTTIDVSDDTTAAQVAATITSIINASTLEIEATAYGSIVQLANKTAGAAGNVAITDNVAATDFYITGMAGGGGGLSWVITVNASADATCYIRLHPNAEQTFSLTAGDNVVTALFNASDEPAEQLDLRIVSSADALFKLTTWSLQGSRTTYVETETVVQVIGEQWACSCLFAKPLWPNSDLVANAPDIDPADSPVLIL